jgi:hypothetical protein
MSATEFLDRSAARLAAEGRPPLARSAGGDQMNTTVNPSRPPFGTRPTQSREELDRLRALLRRRPIPHRRSEATR